MIGQAGRDRLANVIAPSNISFDKALLTFQGNRSLSRMVFRVCHPVLEESYDNTLTGRRRARSFEGATNQTP